MQSFLRGIQGLEKNQYFTGLGPAYVFFLITFLANVWVVYYEIRGGIERLCNIAMLVLFVCGIIVCIRVMTLDTPDLTKPA